MPQSILEGLFPGTIPYRQKLICHIPTRWMETSLSTYNRKFSAGNWWHSDDKAKEMVKQTRLATSGSHSQIKMKSYITVDRGQEYLTGSGSMAGAETTEKPSHCWRHSSYQKCPKSNESKRNILVSPYLLASHTSLLPVLGLIFQCYWG